MKSENKFQYLYRARTVKYITKFGVLLLTGILLAGCSQQTRQKREYAPSPFPKPTARQTVAPEYKLGYGDVVEIKFFNNKQFNELVSVRPDGRITMEKIGDIYVNGMTPSQLDSLITRTYAEIIIDPDVTVFVREFGSYKIYVLGEVNTPGGFDLERNMTVLQAFAAAGGVKTTANLNNIMVLRQGKNGAANALKIDAAEFFDDEYLNLAASDLYLQPQDIVYVSSTFLSDASTFFTQVYSIILPPVDIFLRALLWSRW